MNKNLRTSLAAETVAIVERGKYQTPKGTAVNLRPTIDEAVRSTRLYDAEQLQVLTPPAWTSPARIAVTSESTLAAIQRLSAQSGGHLACLNFASAKNPGGGFLNGAQAQEESLARSSALYACLLNAPAHYERNRRHSSTLYLDLAIFSRSVPFFRHDDGQLLEQPVLASVITCPAPNAGAIQLNEPGHIAEIQPTLSKRAAFVLAVAQQEGVRRLVLGAWGCGVFRNDPRMVAQAFASHLGETGQFSRAFEEVVFAIVDNTDGKLVLRAFEAVFS